MINKKEDEIDQKKINNLKEEYEQLIQDNLIKDLKNQLKKSQNEEITEEFKSESEIIKISNRLSNDIEKNKKFCLEKLLVDFLLVVDNIERSYNLIQKNQEEENTDIIYKINLIISLINDILKKFHVKKINDTNIEFNPDIHQAMSIDYSNKNKTNQVVLVMQAGYILHESRLLRPAMVTVSKNKNNKI